MGIVQKSPDGAMPGSKSWICSVFGSLTAAVNKSIQTKPNVP
jgi:hypothetical protein